MNITQTYAQMESELEAFVDQFGMREVLDCLVAICDAKADHIRTNWGDNSAPQARDWQSFGNRIDSLASKLSPRGNPDGIVVPSIGQPM